MLIDGFQPLSVVRPNSIADLGELIRRARADNTALYPVGGGTTLHLGYSPTKPGHAVEMRGFDQVIDYPARDMTITVQAGITIAKLQQILAHENQRLPIDVPCPEEATLGGAIAVNASGPRRFGFGTLRDYVIGISVMTDGGEEAKAGGRVVKNVAGYDMCKLHIGALGTLGIVTQATLKVKPRPEETRLVEMPIRIDELADTLNRVHASKTRPCCVDVVGCGSNCIVCIGFEDSSESVTWQIDQIRSELQKVEGMTVASNFARLGQSMSNFSVKANLLPSALSTFLGEMAEFPQLKWHCHAGNGIVSANWDGDVPIEHATRVVAKLRRAAVAGQGNVVVAKCPPEWKRDLKVWGEARGDRALMRKVKQALDPGDIFNPGRFVV